jgi:predicted nuclease of predicted toxin-antitoxin system
MKILVDMNLTPLLAEALKRGGVEAVHWASVGAPDALDTAIMAYARENDYIVLTRDLDFGTILAETRCKKPSVIQIRARDARPDVLLDILVQTMNRMKLDLEQGAIVIVDAHKTRLRILPFTPR